MIGFVAGAVRAQVLPCSALILSLMFVSPISRAEPVVAADEAYQAALQSMLDNLGDPESSFDFAKAAVDRGELRGAVSAFERMLRLNPTLANIELELGLLYLRLGNPDLGRYHIKHALQAPNVPAVVRRRAEGYLATAPVQSSRHSLQVSASLDARYDSNANAGPASDVVLFAGNEVLIGSGQQAHDTSLEALVSLTHDYALATEGNASLETRLLLYGTRYQEFSNLDLALGNLEVGPVFRLGGATAPLLLRPFGAAGYYTLDGEGYLGSYGGGVELRKFTQGHSVLSFRLQYEEQDFKDQPTRFVSDRSGGYYSATASLAHQLGSHVQLTTELLAEVSDTQANYQRYDRYGGGLGITWFSKARGQTAPWSIGLSGRVRDASYQSADLQVDPLHEREDTRTDARLTVNIPINRQLTLSLEGIYADNQSNLPNYEYENTGGSIGLSAQF